MIFSENLLVSETIRVVALAGSSERKVVLRKLAEEQAAQGNKVIITSLNSAKIPVVGEIIVGTPFAHLTELLRKGLKQFSIVETGTALQDNLITGLSKKELRLLIQAFPHAHFLVEVGSPQEQPFPQSSRLKDMLQSPLWDQVIYCFNIQLLDKPVHAGLAENPHHFQRIFGPVLTQQAFLSYLMDEAHGLGRMYHHRWAYLLLFTGVADTNLENRVIALARELFRQGITHVAYGWLQENKIRLLRA